MSIFARNTGNYNLRGYDNRHLVAWYFAPQVTPTLRKILGFRMLDLSTSTELTGISGLGDTYHDYSQGLSSYSGSLEISFQSYLDMLTAHPEDEPQSTQLEYELSLADLSRLRRFTLIAGCLRGVSAVESNIGTNNLTFGDYTQFDEVNGIIGEPNNVLKQEGEAIGSNFTMLEGVRFNSESRGYQNTGEVIKPSSLGFVYTNKLEISVTADQSLDEATTYVQTLLNARYVSE